MSTTDLRCSLASASVDEPMAGTAPDASGWLLLEQPGPWGRKAVRESHLDAALGEAIEAVADRARLKLVLIRRPGRHADDHHADATRHVWLASSRPGNAWLRRLEVADPAELLRLDLGGVRDGGEPAVGVRDDEPLLLVCTNAKRDQCCAITGRPVVAAVHADHPGRVWECSHLGGHRFAATGVVLPQGFVHGRLDEVTAAAVLDLASDGRTHLASARGRSSHPERGQAAELAVREAEGLDGFDDVVSVETVAKDRKERTVRVTLADGRMRDVRVRKVEDEHSLRPDSCGKQPETVHRFVTELVPAPR